jgi:hypothetical protein
MSIAARSGSLMKQSLNMPQAEEHPEEISPAADAAMRRLVELFSDPAVVARAHFPLQQRRAD